MITSEFIVNVFDDIVDGEHIDLCRTLRIRRGGRYTRCDLDCDWCEASDKVREEYKVGCDLRAVLDKLRDMGWTVEDVVTLSVTY